MKLETSKNDAALLASRLQEMVQTILSRMQAEIPSHTPLPMAAQSSDIRICEKLTKTEQTPRTTQSPKASSQMIHSEGQIIDRGIRQRTHLTLGKCNRTFKNDQYQ